MAETYYMIGEQARGEELFQEMIRDYPDHVWGYVGYSDQYWMECYDNRDYVNAMKILVKAYERDTLEDGDVVIERMTSLQIAAKENELEEYLQKKDSSVMPEVVSGGTQSDDERPVVPEYSELYNRLEKVRVTKFPKTNI